MGVNIASIGLTKQKLLKILNDNGGATPEAIAEAIAKNNAAMVERINTAISRNIEDLRQELKRK